MITAADFQVFADPTLEGRLAKIRQQLDPKFETIGAHYAQFLTERLQQPFYLHLAKHMRRHKNPPPDTWFALGQSKRGYKMIPHFEVGLWPDHLFVWLDFLADVTNKAQYAAKIQDLPNQMALWQTKLVISPDHTQPKQLALTADNFHRVATDFARNPKAEFLIGQLIPKTHPIFQEGQLQATWLQQTFEALLPIYQELTL